MNDTNSIRQLREALDSVEENGFGENVDDDSVIEIAAREYLAAVTAGDIRMAPPRPDVTRNAGFTIRAVMPGLPAEPGLLESWWVAAERADDGEREWVTWEAYRMDGERAGELAYSGGHYFTGPGAAANKRDALADLAIRAGLLKTVGQRIADRAETVRAPREVIRMARSLRRYLAG